MLAAALPEEGCALLLGTTASPQWQVLAIWPCLNRWQPALERRQRFAIDPREQLLAQKWARPRGWQLLGSLHSHPASAPVPSGLDESLAVRPCLQLIAAPAGPGWTLRAWWLGDHPADPGGGGGPDPIEVPIAAGCAG